MRQPQFFGGDVKKVHDRAGQHATFKELAHATGLRVSPPTLWRSVAYVAQIEILPALVIKALPPSHIVALAGIKEDKKRIQLAERAAKEDLSFQQLSQEVKKAKGASKDDGRGRPPLPPVVKGLKQVERAMKLANSGRISKEDLDEKQLKKLLDRVEKQIAALENIKSKIKALA